MVDIEPGTKLTHKIDPKGTVMQEGAALGKKLDTKGERPDREWEEARRQVQEKHIEIQQEPDELRQKKLNLPPKQYEGDFPPKG